MWNRRQFLGVSAGLTAATLTTVASAKSMAVADTAMRGAIDASEMGVFADAAVDQSRAFQKMLADASDRNMPVFLPAGTYVVSDITLPPRVHLSGVPGATVIAFGGGSTLISGRDAEHIELTGLVFDGVQRPLDDQMNGLVELSQVATVAIDDCTVRSSGKYGIALNRCGGRIDRCEISGAAEAGIYSVDATGLQITANTVRDCGNGGILVHRSEIGEDRTIVNGNRIERILALNGGTGPFGNGINVFRAGNVMVANNTISDCAFTAIRANSASNIQITGNNCARSGETAIYSEFAFEGAVISANIVDGAANGISIVNFNEGGRMAVCNGNLVRNLSAKGPYEGDPPGFGVGIGIEADTSVSGNVIENAPLYGMNIGWGPFMRNVVATGNVIRNAGEGIAVSVVEGTGSAVITDNIIDGARNGAVVGHRWVDAVTGDLARQDTSGIPNILVERNQVS